MMSSVTKPNRSRRRSNAEVPADLFGRPFDTVTPTHEGDRFGAIVAQGADLAWRILLGFDVGGEPVELRVTDRNGAEYLTVRGDPTALRELATRYDLGQIFAMAQAQRAA